MDRIKILDCTLRDGGYINDWKFKHTDKIIKSLHDASIDIIECGFLDPQGDNSTTRYNSFNTVNSYIDKICPLSDKLFVSMIELEKYDPDILPSLHDEPSTYVIRGIRLTFRKSAKSRFLKVAKEIIDKGYKLFVQPISTVSYTDREILDLIDLIKDLDIYALYMVDTHGSIDWHSYDLKRIFTLFDNNLDPSIPIGFHSHNNLQLSYALSCELINMSTNRQLIIDSSLMGMGRGAGNLNTEMICNYLCSKNLKQINEHHIFDAIEKYILPLKSQYTWGYSIPYFLSASSKCHPNYVSFLENNNVSFENMVAILNKIPTDDRLEFNESLIKLKMKEYGY
tara:strand:- start:2379 stop:3395 length:1017 start_codon:yes stop_codon:yes gene_type:complete